MKGKKMDAKMKAKFINSISSEKEVICSKCSKPNEPDSKFCFSCGQLLQGDNKTVPQADPPSDPPSPLALSAAVNEADKQVLNEETNELHEEKMDTSSMICPKCGHSNEADSKFCFSCGNPLEKTENDTTESALQPLATLDTEQEASLQIMPVAEIVPHKNRILSQENAVNSMKQDKQPVEEIVIKQSDAFALGLPSWNLEPPQVVVRRKRTL